MAEATRQGTGWSEASVEEILDSIKRVIARDNRASGGRRSGVERTTAREILPEDAPEPVDADEAEEVLDLGEAGEYLVDGDMDDAEHGLPDDDDDDAGGEQDGALVNAGATESMRQSLEALATLSAPGAAPQIVRSGETSLEGLARELMRPMLAEWLDRNLPGMVEDMVRAEIARIAGKRDR